MKIYAGRVDSVHADAYKMLGSLGRATVEEGLIYLMSPCPFLTVSFLKQKFMVENTFQNSAFSS